MVMKHRDMSSNFSLGLAALELVEAGVSTVRVAWCVAVGGSSVALVAPQPSGVIVGGLPSGVFV